MRRTVFITICLIAASVRAGTYTHDLFARALANDSTAPDYVLITVVDPKTHAERTVCTTANLFLGAIHREHGLGYTEPEIKRAKAIALNQRDRRFVFTRKAALKNLADYATAKALADVRGRFAGKDRLAVAGPQACRVACSKPSGSGALGIQRCRRTVST